MKLLVTISILTFFTTSLSIAGLFDNLLKKDPEVITLTSENHVFIGKQIDNSLLKNEIQELIKKAESGEVVYLLIDSP